MEPAAIAVATMMRPFAPNVFGVGAGGSGTSSGAAPSLMRSPVVATSPVNAGCGRFCFRGGCGGSGGSARVLAGGLSRF